MPTFVHIDHSLCGVGGHEHDCAVNLLRAAEAAGYRVALAANRDFHDHSGLPPHWPVYPVFPHKAYSRRRTRFGPFANFWSGQPTGLPQENGESSRTRRWLRTVSNAVSAGLAGRGSRQSRVERFSSACSRLFGEIELGRGDQVFFATISVADLPGLAHYLAGDGRSQAADWHLQFHEDIYDGQGPNGPHAVEQRLAVGGLLKTVLRGLPHHRLHFYCPTEQLAAQYSEVGAARFQYLPHPVSPALQSFDETEGGPLRVTCAGSARREKGYLELRQLLQDLGSSAFEGRIRLVTQLPKKKLHRAGISKVRRFLGKAHVDLTVLPHPLPADDYHRLIRQTDIGLFLYDSQRYRVRCSAVLQEMLAAGRPVIVPGGSWLAEQIAEPIFRHLETVRLTAPTVRRTAGSDLTWLGGAPSEPAGVDASGNLFLPSSAWITTELEVPETASELLIVLGRPKFMATANNARLETEQFDSHGRLVRQFGSIVGRRADDADLLTLVHLDRMATRVTMRMRCDGPQSAAAVAQVEVIFLDLRRTGGCPAGSVGLVAARNSQIPDLLHDMIQYYHHYRDSAWKFSHSWRQSHSPMQTIEMLRQNVGKDAWTTAGQRVG